MSSVADSTGLNLGGDCMNLQAIETMRVAALENVMRRQISGGLNAIVISSHFAPERRRFQGPADHQGFSASLSDIVAWVCGSRSVKVVTGDL